MGDTYELERRPIAEFVLNSSDVAFQAVTSQRSQIFNVARRLAMKTLFNFISSDSLPPKFLLDKMFGLSISYSENETCRDTGAPPRRGALRAGDRLPDIACTELNATDTEPVYTLQLLNKPPHTALRIILIAETSRGQPASREIEAVLEAFQTQMRQGMPFETIQYKYRTPGGNRFFEKCNLLDACTAGVAHSTSAREFSQGAKQDTCLSFAQVR